VRCNTIHPSGIATPMVASVPALMEEKFGPSPVQEAPVDINKVGEPMDIANAALYLASDESKFVNGAQIRVDNAMSVVSGNMPE
jgi:3(or 17)beta-hydroxysteroid dehydrogenase